MLATDTERVYSAVDLASHIHRETSVFYEDCHFGDRGSGLISVRMCSALVRGGPFAP